VVVLFPLQGDFKGSLEEKELVIDSVDVCLAATENLYSVTLLPASLRAAVLKNCGV
jgi:hypothetical protein